MSSIPETMTAVQLVGHGGPEMLVLRDDVPVPVPGAGEVLIRVGACGMNNTDVNTRVGWYSKAVTGETTGEALDVSDGDASWGGSGIGFPRIQGADICGRVVAVGDGVEADLVGRRVLNDPCLRAADDPGDRERAGYVGSECDGGFAQYCVLPVRNVHTVDSPFTDVELASFPCSWSTAEHMLTRARLADGETVVVTGASGGVGSALVQLARVRGARVVAIAGEAKLEEVARYGADVVVDRNAGNLAGAVAEAAGGPIDVLADVVAGPMFAPLLELLRRGGRYTTAGAIAGPIVDLDVRTLYLNDLEFHGCTVYPPEVFASLVARIESGVLTPTVGGTFPLAGIHAAQEAFVAKRHVGALVIEVP